MQFDKTCTYAGCEFQAAFFKPSFTLWLTLYISASVTIERSEQEIQTSFNYETFREFMSTPAWHMRIQNPLKFQVKSKGNIDRHRIFTI